MQILIIRHAIAEERNTFAATGKSDDLRPLTPKGIHRMHQGTKGLKRIQPKIQLLAHSPLTRAEQTADILATHYPQAKRIELEELTPGASPERLTKKLASLPNNATIALVGHEPDLSELVAWLTIGQPGSFIHLKKGSACLLEYPKSAAPGSAQLHWYLTPRQLRQLAA